MGSGFLALALAQLSGRGAGSGAGGAVRLRSDARVGAGRGFLRNDARQAPLFHVQRHARAQSRGAAGKRSADRGVRRFHDRGVWRRRRRDLARRPRAPHRPPGAQCRRARLWNRPDGAAGRAPCPRTQAADGRSGLHRRRHFPHRPLGPRLPGQALLRPRPGRRPRAAQRAGTGSALPVVGRGDAGGARPFAPVRPDRDEPRPAALLDGPRDRHGRRSLHRVLPPDGPLRGAREARGRRRPRRGLSRAGRVLRCQKVPPASAKR